MDVVGMMVVRDGEKSEGDDDALYMCGGTHILAMSAENFLLSLGWSCGELQSSMRVTAPPAKLVDLRSTVGYIYKSGLKEIRQAVEPLDSTATHDDVLQI